MSAALKMNLISVDDYLAGELVSPIKHEYLGGAVYAMAGARIAHNIIKGNVFASLHARLKGKSCQPYDSDNKVHVRLPKETRYYYPDVFVVWEPNPQSDSFHDRPVVIFEVLSKKTRRTDEREKRDAYLTLPSLMVYVLVEQETAAMVVYRRTASAFERETYHGMDAILPLAEIDAELSFAEVYERVEFLPETGNE